MAALVQCMVRLVSKQYMRDTIGYENFVVGHRTLKRIGFNIRCLKTEAVDEELIAKASEELEEDLEEVTVRKEQALEKKRNKSGLRPEHRNLEHGIMPYSEPLTEFHKTVKYKRKMYARYGEASGVHPGVMWPTREELEEMKEYDSIKHPFTIQELIAQVAEKKRAEEAAFKAREEDLLKKYAMSEQWKKEVQANTAKKLAAAEAARAKKDRLVEEVRRHFGFKIDPKDDRFKELLEQKEKEERRLTKAAKKKARQELAMKHLEEQMKTQTEKLKTET